MTPEDDYDPYDFEQIEGELCPWCDGHRWVPCHCGGDLCFCDNQGEKDCPLCRGEGEVPKDVYDKFVEREREIMEAIRTASKADTGETR